MEKRALLVIVDMVPNSKNVPDLTMYAELCLCQRQSDEPFLRTIGAAPKPTIPAHVGPIFHANIHCPGGRPEARTHRLAPCKSSRH